MELRTEETFSDSDAGEMSWNNLAHKNKIRLPMWRFPVTTGGMRKFLKKLNISVDDYLAANNEKNLKVFVKNNPDWPLRAWVGLQLEWLEWKEKQEVV